MGIYEKLEEIYKNVGYLQKGQQGKQYNYVGSSDVLASVRGQMVGQGVMLEPRIVDTNIRDYTTKTGTTQIFTELVMTMTWVDVENPSDKIELPWYAQGMDLAGEKGVGKALTYGEKYFLLKFFNIATDEADPDAFQQKADSLQPAKKISQAQVNTLNKIIKTIADLVGQTQDQATKVLLNASGLQVPLEEVNENQFGGFLNYLNRTRAKYQEAAKKKQTQKAEQTSLMEGNTTKAQGSD